MLDAVVTTYCVDGTAAWHHDTQHAARHYPLCSTPSTTSSAPGQRVKFDGSYSTLTSPHSHWLPQPRSSSSTSQHGMGPTTRHQSSVTSRKTKHSSIGNACRLLMQASLSPVLAKITVHTIATHDVARAQYAQLVMTLHPLDTASA